MKSKLAIISFILSVIPLITIGIIFGINLLDTSIDFGDTGGLVILIWFLIVPVFALISLSLSIIAIIFIRRNNLEGKKYAITGIVISSIVVLFLIFIFSSSGWTF
ncbi:hypothetical protein GOV12_05875 [Candidatus Pacearchaeota archaeon]|nr:hypothetical protein [Candidatus Pacearchaeota archaeon]